MKKIAFVNQRYGKEVNGGSEYYTMLMAQKMKAYYEVEVLTSKALTYDKWENYYDPDEETIDGILVRRFGVKKKRSRILQRLLKIFITKLGLNTVFVTELWNKVLGPYIPEMVKFIKIHKNEYSAFVFVTYMYYPTVYGMREVADKSIFVPTAHDEYCIYFKVYDKIFHLPRKIIYLTKEEKEFVQRKFDNKEVESDEIGIGIDIPEIIDDEDFRKKYSINGDYLLYAGRVDVDKGCDEMFQFFNKLCENNTKALLIVIGKAYMDIPDQKNIRYLGFISERDKYAAIKGAKLLWLPSRYESLSISVLEAMALGTPVIVNGKCEVLKGHCERSNGGFWYFEYNDFEEKIFRLYKNSNILSPLSAKKYVEDHYKWGSIIDRWREVIDEVANHE